METVLLDILLFLGVVWVILGIAYLWSLFQGLNIKPRKDTEEMKAGKQSVSSKPSVSQEQIDSARHILVGRSKPFTSLSIPEVPAVSPSEKSAEISDTFAGQNVPTGQDTTEKAESTAEEDDNEMNVDYTMDEPDEDTIAREELQLEIGGRSESLIADDSLPEVSPSAILARDIIRVNGWHRNDDALDEEDETDVHETLQTIRGTQLMEYMKEAALGQEQDHQKLLAAIRKVEEAELQENDAATPETDNENDNEGTTEEKPLSYYL
ncbi:conserved hypothetical protein [Prevotella intermedia]|uniref:Uncharacterized protein n=1 Tax=Prevotella intermedia TaxID=28131 RepID=A0A0S3UHM1_PREIN|nr:hypothetical protein [Prevotella intermedia]BAU16994.1 conserved hypothetical protein [Prevotella intermedia]BAU18777.1 conserved hypothetical protein [Prevotella intermedia]BAU18985.1 conserved hypothetical protein [Prevotella intermedia]